MTARRGTAAIALGAALGAIACRPGPAGGRPDLTLANVTVIDGRGGQPLPAQTVEIRNGRIAAVRATRPGDTGLDLTGRFVIPGLIDAHLHLQPPTPLDTVLPALLRGGVTAGREMACCADRYQPLDTQADSIVSPRLFWSAFWAGPAFFTADPRVASTPGAGTAPWLLGVTDTTDLAAAVGAARASGATGIKIYSDLGASLVAAIATEARAQGLRVWSHPAVFPTRPSDVVRAGVQVVSHAALLAWEGADTLPNHYNGDHPFNAFGPPAPYAAVPPDAPAVRAVLEEMRDRGVILDATVSTMRRAVSEEAFAWAARVTAIAHGMGVAVAAGTDREHFVDGHPALLEELAVLVRDAGFTPLEAITAATRTGARVVGRESDLGTIEPGRIADLVVLGADPSRDIAGLRQVVAVVKGGRVLFDARTGPSR